MEYEAYFDLRIAPCRTLRAPFRPAVQQTRYPFWNRLIARAHPDG